MWEFLKRFSTTSTRRPSASDSALVAATKALAELAKGQQKLLAQQQETLDRIVTSRYDRPIERVQTAPTHEQMPVWGMNDQGDVRPDPVMTAIENLGEDSDAAWLEKVQ